MICLIILYGVLFFYIRRQLKNLHVATTSSDHDAQISLKPGNKAQFSTSDISMTKAVTGECQTRQGPVLSMANQAQRRLNQVSRTLLLYPLVYIIVLLPLSIVRVMEFANKNPSLKMTYVVCAIFDCQGLINVFLYTCTRKGIIPWDLLLRKFKRDPMSSTSNSTTDTSKTVVPTLSMASLNQSKSDVEHSAYASYVYLGNSISDDDKSDHEQISTEHRGQKDVFDNGNTNSSTYNYGRGDLETGITRT